MDDAFVCKRRLASEGLKRSFETKAQMRSPRYTTRLTDLPVVRAQFSRRQKARVRPSLRQVGATLHVSPQSTELSLNLIL
ncbi:DUF4113 domain-containing protein [Rhizobium sp. VS19-DR104.2]|uniref:DUF4113 domain-containing protein n=1 Tax=unclassified Rhizobium TaxID=2613769 RepID=UPI001C5B425A|nr:MULTISPECIES: DUF4113 domain-containing protein [unclassified Rhizobium]MBZ5762526.1 DUF4113 domain-containing protein [Rhizobium sp. VS19-DR96]MBZ5768459.1 DUF4113 domain-containing protein [Rhizobium sp. VS19-DR129.2]MBZ5775977.1 DUF4113 domain-containing protein [Rhizobium sp. VS19-DRK62.2]MBZ5787251.1 DUF4113 domain-containing protein [Rhizobium sp. VS19-DR121]MBZ5804604.1 DUF4113 domain-containing protein [Rhizobium sp. VS19-DR181]